MSNKYQILEENFIAEQRRYADREKAFQYQREQNLRTKDIWCCGERIWEAMEGVDHPDVIICPECYKRHCKYVLTGGGPTDGIWNFILSVPAGTYVYNPAEKKYFNEQGRWIEKVVTYQLTELGKKVAEEEMEQNNDC